MREVNIMRVNDESEKQREQWQENSNGSKKQICSEKEAERTVMRKMQIQQPQ